MIYWNRKNTLVYMKNLENGIVLYQYYVIGSLGASCLFESKIIDNLKIILGNEKWEKEISESIPLGAVEDIARVVRHISGNVVVSYEDGTTKTFHDFISPPPIKIGDYPVEIGKKGVRVGCQYVEKAQIEEILRQVKGKED